MVLVTLATVWASEAGQGGNEREPTPDARSQVLGFSCRLVSHTAFVPSILNQNRPGPGTRGAVQEK
jgi:hypothetical protein